MAEKKVGNYIYMALVLLMAIIMLTGNTVAAADDLSAAYKLEYSIVDGNFGDHFQVTQGDDGVVELLYPFISGGCIAVNELIIKSVEPGNNGVPTVNLLWNCDQGRPCKAYIPVQLRVGLQLPGPGKYLIKLWAYETVGSEKINLLGEQEIEKI